MEIILQWIDDVEDSVIAVAFVWQRSRRRYLRLGLFAALILQMTASWAIPLPYVLGLAAVSAVSVGTWSIGLLGDLLAGGLNRGWQALA